MNGSYKRILGKYGYRRKLKLFSFDNSPHEPSIIYNEIKQKIDNEEDITNEEFIALLAIYLSYSNKYIYSNQKISSSWKSKIFKKIKK